MSNRSVSMVSRRNCSSGSSWLVSSVVCWTVVSLLSLGIETVVVEDDSGDVDESPVLGS